MIACSVFSVLPAGTVHTQDARGAWTTSEDKAIVEGCDLYLLASGDRVETYGAGGANAVLHLYSGNRIAMSYNANGSHPNAYLYAYDAEGKQTVEKVRGRDAEGVRTAILGLIGK